MPVSVAEVIRCCARTIEAARVAELESCARCLSEGSRDEAALHHYAAQAMEEVVGGFLLEAQRLEEAGS